MKVKSSCLLVASLVLASASTVSAVGYASGVTKVGDDVTFILNQNSYGVKAILDNGAATLDLPTAAGQITFNMAGYSYVQD